MDKQKLVKSEFPLIDAILTMPPEGSLGTVGICVNATAAGQVLNEIKTDLRSNVCVLGSLIVNRDGAERMIVNCLAHPTQKYLILFSEESATFSPSTNLLQAIRFGLDTAKAGNYIAQGVAASPQYPNLSARILELFKQEILVLPIFMSKNRATPGIVAEYIEWLKPRISEELYEALLGANKKDKIYYDTLNKIVKIASQEKAAKKNEQMLDAKDFQALQPPKIRLTDKKGTKSVPFLVTSKNKEIRVDFMVKGKPYFITGDDDFTIGHALMRFLGESKNELSPIEQLLLGYELGRARVEVINGIHYPSFVRGQAMKSGKRVEIESDMKLIMDARYYYRIGIVKKNIHVACLSFDACEQIFELVSKSPYAIIERLGEMNRFEQYEMDILHRIDVGSQLARAAIAADLGYAFIQDFNTLFKTNTKDLPLVIAEGESFLSAHKGLLTKIYTEGIAEPHADEWKGIAQTAVALAVFRDAEKALKVMPPIYQLGDQDTVEMRKAYKAQLLRFDHDGSYSYGERTRSFFGFDQLEMVPKVLKKDPTKAVIVQRFDPIEDMNMFTKEDGKVAYSHDPCLTHDIYFIAQGRLHSFHIARAHNAVNAYPENIFGLHDAYAEQIRKKVSIESGDMFMLSSRANILLLTEEQRTKKLLAEPAKPVSTAQRGAGPYRIGESTKRPPKGVSGVAYVHKKAEKVTKRPKSDTLDRLENYQGVDILAKAIDYLRRRGTSHNNPIISDYKAGVSDPQAEGLVFFQCNEFGKRLHATAVFVNRSIKKTDEDIEVCNYMMSQYGKKLKRQLGDLTIFYVAFH